MAAEQQEAAARELQQQRDEEVARRLQAAELAQSVKTSGPNEARHPRMLAELMLMPTLAKLADCAASLVITKCGIWVILQAAASHRSGVQPQPEPLPPAFMPPSSLRDLGEHFGDSTNREGRGMAHTNLQDAQRAAMAAQHIANIMVRWLSWATAGS